MGQEDSAHATYVITRPDIGHPDGLIGKPALHGSFQYASVTKEAGIPVVDIQQYQVSLNLVSGRKLTLLSRFEAVHEDSIIYDVSGGLRYYLADPTKPGQTKNADGRIGVPVVSLLAGWRYANEATSSSMLTGEINLDLPVSSSVTVSAGYRYFKTLAPADVEQGFAGITYYFASYSADSAYVNPDGPVGSMVIRIRGGGSSNGFFAETGLLFPISPSLSLGAFVRGESFSEYERRSAAAGVVFSLYPTIR